MEGWRGSVNQVYPDLVNALIRRGDKVGPRGTETLELSPVVLTIVNPDESIVTSRGRPINLTFALAEVLWILQGRRDVEMLSFYNASIGQFSDNGSVFNAAYGYRLRHAHGHDQITDAIYTLQEDSDSRRATLVMWHPDDAGFSYRIDNPDEPPEVYPRITKDRACNVLAHAMIRDDRLNWMQVVRSNDVILGVPYNFIQWTAVQAYMAGRLGILPGKFEYVADSMHIYTDGRYYPAYEEQQVAEFDLYALAAKSEFTLPPLLSCTAAMLQEAEAAEELIRQQPDATPVITSNSFWAQASEMFVAHRAYRERRDEEALGILIERANSIWGITQAKFYWSMRWKKLSDPYILATIEEAWGAAVADWCIDRVHVSG